MTRILSLLFVVGLAAGLFLLPTPDPLRLAALRSGGVLAEAVHTGTDWQARMGPGDRVRVRGDLDGLPAGVAEGTLERGPTWPGSLGLAVEGLDDPLPVAREDVEELLEARPMWRYLLESPATIQEGEVNVIRLGGARMTSTALTVDDLLMHGYARSSMIRTLRATLASNGIEYRIDGAVKPEPGGCNIEVRHVPGSVLLAVDVAGLPTTLANAEWRTPTRQSLYPPLIAILLAILFRKPVLALFAGVFTGTFLEAFGDGTEALPAVGSGFQALFDTYFWNELLRTDRQQIVLFVIFMLAMVGVMTRSGGIRGMMDVIARLASSVRRTQIATWLMGLAIFFDDYANTILVGSTMRPLTDRFKIAREKLAYIVDSTAAPVAGLSIFSTWIAFEVSTFSAQLPDVGLTVNDGYRVFLETLPYRFYCIFTLAFVALVVFSGRDFGPMLEAERRARGGKLLRDGAQPMVGKHATNLDAAPGITPAASRALVPILTFVTMTLLWIGWKGGAFQVGMKVFTIEGLATVLYNGDSFMALMVGSGVGFLVSCAMATAAGAAKEIPGAAWTTVRSMGIAFAILYLAWMIGAVCGNLGTAPYLTVLVGEKLNPLLLPVILFLLSGVVAFATGSSWSTMTILLPIVVALAYNLGEATEFIGGYMLMLISIGAVLEGAIFGDHCSPISDTTVMSSIASASDHIDHVRTQAPYAILTMVVAMLVGYLPCTFLGLSPWLAILLGIAALTGFLFYAGRRAEPA